MEITTQILHSKPYIDDADINAVISTLKSGHLEEGNVVHELEEYFIHKYKYDYAFAVSSGFSAILLSLIALNTDENSEIILPSYVCQAVLNPIKIIGAKPVIVDIEENSFNISVNEVLKKINKNTKAIIVPHIFGFPAKIDELKMLGIPLIEDCSQSLGGMYHNKQLGCFGDISVFSFYSTKMVSAGDGGMIITRNKNYAKKIEDYRYYGHKKLHSVAAYNFHLTNLPASLALSQLGKLDFFVKKRKEISVIYDNFFTNLNNQMVNFENKEYSCYYRYPIRVNNAEKIIGLLKTFGVFCGYGVLDGMHQIMGCNNGFHNTEHNLKTIVSIPIYPSLSNEDTEYIINTFKKILI